MRRRPKLPARSSSSGVRPTLTLLALGALSAGLALTIGACQERERPPALGLGGGGNPLDAGDIDIGGGCEPPPEINPSCGSEIVPVLQQKPNLYFVLDISGSMEDPITSSRTKLAAAKSSILSVTLELGHRINYGMMTYPGPDADALYPGCGVGVEVFPTQAGDAITCVNEPARGEVYEAFRDVVSDLDALGGTPLAASLEAIAPRLQQLAGPTAVILLTDGAPNCNADTVCDVEDCVLNIASQESAAGTCLPGDADFNCCDPALSGQTGYFDALSYCITSDQAVAQVSALAAAGIPTYVIGVPGVEAFTDVMNSLAEAGGTARDGALAYYDASDVEELTSALRTIGAAVAQSCEIELQRAPVDSGFFNVYFDAELVKRDAADGWTINGKQVTLHGDACDRLQKGQVGEIQMVAGCISVVL